MPLSRKFGKMNLRGLPKKQKVEILRQAMAAARKPKVRPKRPFLTARVGTIGVSGPGGIWFKEQMVREVERISTSPKSPNAAIATKIFRVLSRARSEEVFAEGLASENQVLLNILNGVLLAEKRKGAKPFRLNPNQKRVLDYWFSRAKLV